MTRKSLLGLTAWLCMFVFVAICVAIGVAPEATEPFVKALAHHTSITLTGLAVMGYTVKSQTIDRDTIPTNDTLRQQYNKLVDWTYYRALNYLMSTTTATLPAITIATTASKVRTTQATVAKCAGVANAVGSTDNAWTLTGGNLATGFSRRYLLLVDAADTFTVQASDDQESSADCTWDHTPADGLCILGIVTVDNASGAVFIPGTTLLSAAGITDTYIDDIDAGAIPAKQISLATA